MQLIDYLLHLNRYLNEWAGELGGWLYLVLFIVVFCETGLVVTPFLPGDSLLFAVGALSASEGSPIDLYLVAVLLCIAAVAGDAANYSIGYRLGPRVFSREDSWLLNKKHLIRTQDFYERHGGKTIVIARFIPIIRTFAPFVAGIGKMRYARFAVFNVSGGVVWVLSFLVAGHLFGDIPWVEKNFSSVIIAIILISTLPLAIEWILARRRARRGAGPGGGPAAVTEESVSDAGR
jgi:membrane-associated protein